MVMQRQIPHSESFLRGQRDGQLFAEDCPRRSESDLRVEAELQLHLISSVGATLQAPNEYVQGLFAGYQFQFSAVVYELLQSLSRKERIVYQTPVEAASTIGFMAGYKYAIRAVSPQGKTSEVVERQMTQDEQIVAFSSLLPIFRQRWRKGYHCWHIQQIAHAYVASSFPNQQFVCGETRQQGDDEHSSWECAFLIEDLVSEQKVSYRMHIHWVTEVEGIAVNWWMISTLEKEENAL